MENEYIKKIQEMMNGIVATANASAHVPLTEEQVKKVIQTRAMLLDIVTEKALDFLLEDEETIARANALATTLKNILDIKA